MPVSPKFAQPANSIVSHHLQNQSRIRRSPFPAEKEANKDQQRDISKAAKPYARLLWCISGQGKWSWND